MAEDLTLIIPATALKHKNAWLLRTSCYALWYLKVKVVLVCVYYPRALLIVCSGKKF